MTELANNRDAYITVRVPRRLVDQLDRLAQRELISRSDFVRRVTPPQPKEDTRPLRARISTSPPSPFASSCTATTSPPLTTRRIC